MIAGVILAAAIGIIHGYLLAFNDALKRVWGER
jgi:hypothetical protein